MRRVRLGIVLLIAAVALDTVHWLIYWLGMWSFFVTPDWVRRLTVSSRAYMFRFLLAITLALMGSTWIALFASHSDLLGRWLQRFALGCIVAATVGLLSAWVAWLAPTVWKPPIPSSFAGLDWTDGVTLLSFLAVGAILIRTVDRRTAGRLYWAALATFVAFALASAVWLSYVMRLPPAGLWEHAHRVIGTVDLLVVLCLFVMVRRMRPHTIQSPSASARAEPSA